MENGAIPFITVIIFGPFRFICLTDGFFTINITGEATVKILGQCSSFSMKLRLKTNKRIFDFWILLNLFYTNRPKLIKLLIKRVWP